MNKKVKFLLIIFSCFAAHGIGFFLPWITCPLSAYPGHAYTHPNCPLIIFLFAAEILLLIFDKIGTRTAAAVCAAAGSLIEMLPAVGSAIKNDFETLSYGFFISAVSNIINISCCIFLLTYMLKKRKNASADLITEASAS